MIKNKKFSNSSSSSSDKQKHELKEERKNTQKIDKNKQINKEIPIKPTKVDLDETNFDTPKGETLQLKKSHLILVMNHLYQKVKIKKNKKN